MGQSKFNLAIISVTIITSFAFFANGSFSAELPVKFFFGHNGQVLSAALSPIAPILASTNGKEINIWNIQNTKEIAELTGHSARVTSLNFSSQGLLASSSEDETIILWDVEKFKQIRKLIGHSGAVSSVAFSPDGQLLASGGNDQVVKIWEVNTGRELATLRGHTDAVFAVAFSPDGKLIASGSGDGSIRLWSSDTYKQVKVLQGHTGYVWTLAFSPDGTQLASGSWDGTVRLWNLKNGTSEVLADFNTFVLSVDYSPNDELLAVGLLNCEPKNTIRIWHLKSKKELRAFETKSVRCLSFSPDGRGLVASGSSDGMIKMWSSIVDNAPVPLSPKSDTLIQTPYVTLTWDKTFGAVYYEVEIAKNRDFTDIVQEATSAAYEKFDFKVGSEPKYWWHVRSCGFGEVGDWSPPLSFKTIPELPQAIVRVNAPSTQVYKNSDLEVDVEVENAEDLAEFQIDDFSYNSKVLDFVELKNIGKIFGSLNVKLVEPPKIDNEKGVISHIVVAEIKHRAVPYQGILFTAKFKAKATGVTDLQLQNVLLTDSNQNNLKCKVILGNVKIVEIHPYDINEDGKVDILDLVMVSKSLGKKIDTAVTPNPDVNQDGIVDNKDLELVEEHLGEKYYLPPEPPELNPTELTSSAPAELSVSQLIDEKPQNWLGQNYPNPFNPETWIPYSLSQNSHVTIVIYNLRGKRTRTLNLGYQLAGKHINRNSAVYWNGKNELGEQVPSGVYFYSIYTEKFTKTKKMVVLQ